MHIDCQVKLLYTIRLTAIASAACCSASGSPSEDILLSDPLVASKVTGNEPEQVIPVLILPQISDSAWTPPPVYLYTHCAILQYCTP